MADPCASTATVAASTATGGSCALGDTGPGGGTIFYLRYVHLAPPMSFEVACGGWSEGTCGGDDLTDPTAEWGCFGTPISGADGTAIGTGEQNTLDIVAGCWETGIAVKVADDLVLGGQDDWFLPSRDELNELCKWAYGDTVNAVCNDNGAGSLTLTYGGFSTGRDYWRSSEYDDYDAWYQYFNLGNQSNSTKGTAYYVRPVRAF